MAPDANIPMLYREKTVHGCQHSKVYAPVSLPWEHLFRDRTKRACVIADFFSGSGRAVQLWNSIRYLESQCRLCKAISQNEIGEEAGHALFRLLLNFAQTGSRWMLLEPGMTKATEGTPSFVQRSADEKTTSHQWISGIDRILSTMPGEGDEGKPPEKMTRGMVSTTKGVYACLGAPMYPHRFCTTKR